MKRLVLFLMLFVAFTAVACREQSKEEVFQQGMEFANAGNHAAAISLFKSALEKDPNYTEARLQLGIAYHETSKLDKAENELEKVLRQEPDNKEISFRLAQIYSQTERSDKAIYILAGLERTQPENVEIKASLAQCYALQGDYASGEENYRKALAIQSTHLQSQLGLTSILFATGRLDEAEKYLQSIIEGHPQNTAPFYLKFKQALQQGNREEAIQALERISSISSSDVGAVYTLAMLYLDVGELEKCRSIAEKLLADYPDHPAGARIMGVYSYLTKDYESALTQLQESLKRMPDLAGFYFTGLVYYRLNQFEQALSSFQKALDINPDHEYSRLMLSQTFLKQGRIEDSIHEAKKTLTKNPKSGQAYNLLGSAYLAKGQYDLAMEQLDEAIEVDPSLAEAHFKKGLFNLASGNRNQGAVDLQNALNAAPEVLNTRLLLAAYYLKQHNYPEVIKTLESGLNGSPDSALIYNFMAAAYFAQNKPDEAIASLQKAKKAKPDYFAPYFNMANYYLSRGDLQPALGEYHAVLELAPNNLHTHLKLASLYELNGDPTKAEHHYTEASKTDEPSGYIAYAAFLLRNARQKESIEVINAGYVSHPDNYLLMVVLGEELQKRKQYDEAIKIYIRMEETSPGKGMPLLIGAHLRKGDVAAANNIALRVITENPKKDTGYLLQSAIHEYLKEWSLAESAIKRGLDFDKESLALHMNLGRLYSSQKRFGDAQGVYDTILLTHADFIPALFARGAIYDQLGNKRKAQDIYKQILEKNENYAPALNNLAYLTMDVYADNKTALELATRAFRNAPNDAGIMDTLGYALLKNGKVEQSIVFLEKARSVLPDEAAVRIHLAQAYKAAGRKDDAVANLTVINDTNAQETQIREARALLKELN